MSGSSAIFSGTSRFASDFSQVIERAVKIASLPLMQLQSQKSALSDRSTALASLETRFSALSASITSLESAGGLSSMSATASDETVLRAATGSGVLEGEYGIQVLSIGAYSSAMSVASLPTVSSPATQNISSAASFTLTVDAATTTITPASNSLSSLVTAINAAGAGVKATLVNVGTSAAPDYKLALRTEKLGAISVQLNDGTTDLLETLATGSLLTYQVNGQPATPISSDSRTVTISPGLTAELRAVGTSTVTVSRTGSAAKDALQAFVTAYNSAIDEMDLHRGTAKGALNGNPLLASLSNSLRSLTSYSTGSGAVRTLADVGLSLDQYGKLSLDGTEFDAAAAANLSAVFDFLGSSTSAGFLKTAHDVLDRINDASDSSIQLAQDSVTRQITAQDEAIADNQDRVDALRERLAGQMAAADALIATLEQQVLIVTGLFEAQKANNGK
ncbi:MAG: flagellar filament capping protein FliD [Acidobacteria bacterium]|nr:flagellar filament capping protein FliD [Acidobacteriota bacterium]